MGAARASFLTDTQGVDTVPLKMVFYLAVTGVIIVLMAVSWNNLSPLYSGARDSKQINDAALEIVSIQDGYARDVREPAAPDGSMCTIELSLPDVSYLAFGVDPDPDMNGNLSDSTWVAANNTLICQYSSGSRNLYQIEGDLINFRKGTLANSSGSWMPDENAVSSGVVIEGPITGEFTFELVLDNGKYTLSHF